MTAFDPRTDVRDITPGYDRIGERTVRHDRVLLICGQCGSAATVEVSDEHQSILICAECGDDSPGIPAPDHDLRAERGISPDDVEYCDDCYRPWGECNPEVEH